jgi:hypothetical protein
MQRRVRKNLTSLYDRQRRFVDGDFWINRCLLHNEKQLPGLKASDFMKLIYKMVNWIAYNQVFRFIFLLPFLVAGTRK